MSVKYFLLIRIIEEGRSVYHKNVKYVRKKFDRILYMSFNVLINFKYSGGLKRYERKKCTRARVLLILKSSGVKKTIF